VAIRDRFLRALVLFGVALVAITESLGAFSLIRPGPLILCWSVVLLLALVYAARQPFRPAASLRRLCPLSTACRRASLCGGLPGLCRRCETPAALYGFSGRHPVDRFVIFRTETPK